MTINDFSAYFFRGQDSRSPLGWITMAGRNDDTTAQLSPDGQWRTLGMYALDYNIKGHLTFRDACGSHREINPGDLMLFYPEVAHHLDAPPEAHRTSIFLIFDGPVFRLWEQAGLLDPAQPVHHLEPIDYWESRFMDIIQEASRVQWQHPVFEVCRLQDLLAEALLANSPLPRGDSAAWINRACMLLERNVTEPLDLPRVAHAMGTHYEYFRKKFARLVGMSPSRYRYSILVKRAAELLITTNMSIREVALNLGFCDEFYFSNQFKRIMGHAPSQFRRMTKSESLPD